MTQNEPHGGLPLVACGLDRNDRDRLTPKQNKTEHGYELIFEQLYMIAITKSDRRDGSPTLNIPHITWPAMWLFSKAMHLQMRMGIRYRLKSVKETTKGL